MSPLSRAMARRGSLGFLHHLLVCFSAFGGLQDFRDFTHELLKRGWFFCGKRTQTSRKGENFHGASAFA
jgi:hypothetical protein